MGRTFGRGSGKLLDLHSLPREEWGAIEADLLERGFLLADVPGRVTWRALLAMIKYSPHTSALAREMYGDQVTWSVTDHLLAGILDYSAVIAWLNSDTKKNERPEPVQRPGQKKPEQAMGTAVPVSDFQRLWDENIARAQLETGGDQGAGGSRAGDPEHHPVDAGVAGSDRPRDARGRYASRGS